MATGDTGWMAGRTLGPARHIPLLALAVMGLTNCDGSLIDLPGAGDAPRFAECELNLDYLIVAAGRDAISTLDDPVWERVEESIPSYLDPDTRVVGVVAFGLAHAIPLNVLWHHEIVNLDLGGPNGPKLAITHCPLTGSSLVFDRQSVGGATLGVSGLLFMNNLLVYDRREPDESLWPQMLAEAGCGPRTGAKLTHFPSVEMEWAEWLTLHPATRVLAAYQGFDTTFFDYTRFGYPYGDYRQAEDFFKAAMPPLDGRRFSKERVLGVPSTSEDPGIAFPFGALTELEGTFQVVDFVYEGRPAVTLWSDAAQGGMAFRLLTEDGDPLTLRVEASGFVDNETGSEWSLEGRAVAGPLESAQLVPLERTHTAYWGAWAAFHPDTRLWEGEE